jgi:hypothetical protein
MAVRTTPLENGQAESLASTEVSTADRAMGASMIASGIGAVVLGILVVLAEANAQIKSALAWSSAVGPLSGKTSLMVLAFLVSWAVLHYIFQRRAVRLTTSFIWTISLLAVGLVLTFPPVYTLFAP